MSDVKEFLKEFRGEFGDDVIFTSEDREPVEVRSSGSLLLDIALGGGYIKGGVVSSQGGEGSGKSTTALLAIAQAQRDEPDKLNMLVDLEYSFDPSWAELLGVDVSKLLVVQPSTSAGKVYEQIHYAVTSKKFAIIVLDSLDGLITEAELTEEDFDKESRVGGASKVNTKAMRKVVYSGDLHESGTTFIIIQQLRDDLGGFSMYGTPTTVTGGRSVRHAIHQRLEVSVSERFTEGTGRSRKYFGQTIFIRLTKNKVGPPFRTAEIDLFYEEGIDRVRELVRVAEIVGVLPAQGGGWRRLTDPTTGELFYKEGVDPSKAKPSDEIKWQGEDNTHRGLIEDIENNDGKIYRKVYELVQEVLYA